MLIFYALKGIIILLFNAVAIDCGGLSFPVNGEARISPNSKLGGLAIYKCRFGYELIGTDTRICQSDGRWSSRSPACRSKTKGTYIKYNGNTLILRNKL